MRTDFLYKRRFLFLCCGIVFSVIVGICALYRFYPRKALFLTQFHFLVSEDTNIEASAELIKLEGGAGYLLREKGRDYVVLSVYLNKKDGLAVQEVLANQNTQTRLISVSVGNLIFRGIKEQKNSDVYIGALQSLYGCLNVLEETVARLEKGMTQEKTKGILSQLKEQLSFMSEVYASSYPSFSSFSAQVADKIEKEKEGVVYVSKLRYLLCETVEGYLEFVKEFS